MNATPTDHERIKRYLLGHLPEEDESQVEARLLTDREFYDELSIFEDELIDRYLGSKLSDSDRQSFETHFVSSRERQQKVRFARALRKKISATADQVQPGPVKDEMLSNSLTPASGFSRPRSWGIFAFRGPLISYAVVAAILIIAGGSFLLLRSWRRPSVNGTVLAIELTPAPATRDGSEVKQFSLKPGVEFVRLQLDLTKNEYQSYEAVLRDSSLRTVLTTKNLKPQIINSFAAVIVDVKTDLLAPGDYRIELSGTTTDGLSERVATFSFSIRTS